MTGPDFMVRFSKVEVAQSGVNAGVDQKANMTPSTDNSAQHVAAPKDSTLPAPTCESDWKACKDNADLVNNSRMSMIHAKIACKESVGAHAKYGEPKWCSGWFCEDFGKFRTGSDASKTGLITIVDDKVQLQNGFGAWPHVTANCTYNLKTNAVENLFIDQQE
jgi:hypothetical protein